MPSVRFLMVALGSVTIAVHLGACKSEPRSSSANPSAPKVAAEPAAAAPPSNTARVAAEKLAAQVAAADTAIAAAKAAAEARAAESSRAATREAERVEHADYVRALRAVIATEPPLAPLPVQYEPEPTLPEKMERRIRFRLRELSNAPVALTQIVHVPRDDGGSEVFALYQVSLYEECMRGYATRNEGRKQCLWKDGQKQLACVRGGVVWAAFAPPAPSTSPEQGGALTVQTLAFDPKQCTFSAKEMIVGDLDEDGKLELMLTLLQAHEPPMDNRGMWNHSYAMTFYLLSSGLQPTKILRSDIADWHAGNDTDGLSPESPIELRDVNRDGRRDLVEYEPLDLERCNRQRHLEEGELDPCVDANRIAVIYAYDEATAWWAPASLAWLEALAPASTP